MEKRVHLFFSDGVCACCLSTACSSRVLASDGSTTQIVSKVVETRVGRPDVKAETSPCMRRKITNGNGKARDTAGFSGFEAAKCSARATEWWWVQSA